MAYLYKKAILGGTFDHFHIGHEALLDVAFTQAEHVTIGLTQPVMYQQKFLASTIESFEIRKANLIKYLTEKEFDTRYTIIPITDIYGTTLEDESIEAIFVTEENLSNVKLINSKRNKKGFSALKIVVIPYKTSTDGQIITSERMRRGEIDRVGLVYKSLFDKKTLSMPESLRTELQKPLGEIVENTNELLKILDQKTMIIAVGDIIAASLKKNHFVSAIDIIDFKTRRHKIKTVLQLQAIKAYNKQSTINRDAVNAIHKALMLYLKTNKKQTIVISGEEDLLALPVILLAPLGSVVLYGQHDIGIVVNYVTAETKKNISQLVKKFE